MLLFFWGVVGEGGVWMNVNLIFFDFVSSWLQ
jgi:hypothetical protein